MIITIIITGLTIFFFYKSKEKRATTGAVRTPETWAFAIFAVIAILLWIRQILGVVF